ncbi:hypothetical protein HI914_04499 [Erysiphe necator]|nr:hypothetical protein HI914_04499 [Erysiphe necator]
MIASSENIYSIVLPPQIQTNTSEDIKNLTDVRQPWTKSDVSSSGLLITPSKIGLNNLNFTLIASPCHSTGTVYRNFSSNSQKRKVR